MIYKDRPKRFTAFISGDMNRFFVWAPNYKAQMEISYIPNPSRDNLSLRLRSRHNESYTHENRFGGYGGGGGGRI